MSKENWIWMPHAGHFICADSCQFRLNTYVNGYIVSTVGQMKDGSGVGDGRLYETMVFKAKKSKHKCCPYVINVEEQVDFSGYNDPGAARSGHMRLCR